MRKGPVQKVKGKSKNGLKSLKKKNSSWLLKAFLIMSISGTLLLIGGVWGVYLYFSKNLPKIITVADYHPLGVTRIIGTGAQGDAELGEFFKERRYLIPYEKIPQSVVQAFISAEDDKFFEHPGINISSIIRAGIANFKAGHVVQGGAQ
jgi:penicillin-binding protein 1A